MSRHRPRGFTLIELLVVVAIIGVLIALLLPAVQSAREAARRVQCVNHLKQIGLALHVYHNNFGRFPSNGGVLYGPGANYEDLSYMVSLLPFIEQKTLYDRIDRSLAEPERTIIDGRPLVAHVIPVFLCPSETQGPTLPAAENCDEPPLPFESAIGAYAGSVGSQQMDNSYPCNLATLVGAGDPDGDGQNWFGNGSAGYGGDVSFGGNDPKKISGVFSRCGWSARLADITDGTANTIGLMEVRMYCGSFCHAWQGWADARAMWYATTAPINFPTCANEDGVGGPPGRIPYSEGCHASESYSTTYGAKSLHPGGANFCLCDGSVRFLSENIDYPLYQALGDRHDGVSVSGRF